MNSSYGKASNKYQSVDLHTRVEAANPHQLIEMLFDGAKLNINAAITHMNNGNIAKKGEHVGKALAIVGGLRESLNIELGGELAQNLDKFYISIQQLLLHSNMKDDVSLLSKANVLLNEVGSAWKMIRPRDSE